MTDQASAAPTMVSKPESSAGESPLAVTVLHGDDATREAIEAGLGARDGMIVEVAADAPGVLDRLGAVDAVVTDGEFGPELVERIRERDQRLPVVLHTDAPREPLLAAVGPAGFVDLVRPTGEDPAVDVLAHRLCALVDHSRTAALARHATAATEATTDGLAVLGDDGTVVFANDQLARQLGADRETIVGRPWRELFDEASVGRLESDALSAVDDGWQWVGTCEARRPDGDTVALRTLVTDAADGSVVLAVLGSHPEDGD
jgi:PAS domain S-box-containing protein